MAPERSAVLRGSSVERGTNHEECWRREVAFASSQSSVILSNHALLAFQHCAAVIRELARSGPLLGPRRLRPDWVVGSWEWRGVFLRPLFALCEVKQLVIEFCRLTQHTSYLWVMGPWLARFVTRIPRTSQLRVDGSNFWCLACYHDCQSRSSCNWHRSNESKPLICLKPLVHCREQRSAWHESR